MDKYYFQKFKRDSRRMKGHDYSSSGIYFITITTDAQIMFFGNIKNDKVILSPAGKIVLKNWLQISANFPFVSLDQFIIMPDHIHAIIIINDNNSILSEDKNKKTGGITGKNNPMISQNSLSYIIRWFKAKSTYQIRKTYPKLSFAWQSRFYDRIIKDKKSLYAVRHYIRNNPKLNRD